MQKEGTRKKKEELKHEEQDDLSCTEHAAAILFILDEAHNPRRPGSM